MIKKSFVFFLFCVLCEQSFAAIFDVAPLDQSKFYLSKIFGGSVGAISLGGGNNPTLSMMFERFNFIIVTLGAVVLSYIGILTTINTAREGEAMGKKISLWVPLRAFSGMLLMVPGPTTGYSVVQMTVMWLVLNGIGAANSIWDVVLGQLSKQVSAVGGLSIALSPAADFNGLTPYVLQASTCLHKINDYMPELRNNAGPMQGKTVSIYTVVNPASPPPSAPNVGTITQTANVFVGVQGAAQPLDRLCGVFNVTTSVSQGDPLNTFNYSTVSQRLTIKTTALQAMFAIVDPAAQLLANTTNSYTPPQPGYSYAAGSAYVSQIAALATGVSAAPGANAQPWEQGVTANPLSSSFQTLKNQGWIHAGSYYFTMVKASNANMDPETRPGTAKLPTPSNVPMQTSLVNGAIAPAGAPWPASNNTTSGLSSILSAGGSYNEVANMNQALQQAMSYWTADNTLPPPPAQGLGINEASTGSHLLDKILNGIKEKIEKPILDYFLSIASGSVNMGSQIDSAIHLEAGVNAATGFAGQYAPQGVNAVTGFAVSGTNAAGITNNASGTNLSQFSGTNLDTSAKAASGDPLVSLGQFGGLLMLAGEIAVIVAIVTSATVSLALSIGSCISPFPFATNLVLLQILPMLYGLTIAAWSLGATLGIYLPLVPYLVFTLTAFGWFIQVIEAVVAAPIIALGLVHPAGGEELGKIAAALPILANIFLKPTLMIFGFVLGASLLRAGIALVNFGFIPAIQNTVISSLFSIIAFLTMYVGIVTAIVNKSFSLIYILPNQIMRWMGGQAEGGEPSEMVREAHQGFEKGSQATEKAGMQGVSGGTDSMKENFRTAKDNKNSMKNAKNAKKT